MEIPAQRFRQLVDIKKPVQIVGAINAYAAIMAKQVGFEALYLSGAGVANAAYGLPDLGMTTLDNVLTEAQRIIDAVDLPLLVDIDTGWGNELTIGRSIKMMERAGVAAVHIEDQPFDKRCGHRIGKSVISKAGMVDRIKAAVDARTNPDFVIMARTDAYAIEGLEKTIDRCLAYENAGADMHFVEALTTLDEYRACAQALKLPILANITEFGQTPLFKKEELGKVGVSMILYPLSAWRAMCLAGLKVLHEIHAHGTQIHLLDQMQTREELYGFLDYERFEKRL